MGSSHTTYPSPVQEVKERIQKMTPKQRKEVFDYLCLLNAGGPTPRSGTEVRERQMWSDVVREEFSRITLVEFSPRAANDALRNAEKEAHSIVEAFLTSSGTLAAISRTYEKRAIYQFLARLLVTDSRSVARVAAAPLTLIFIHRRAYLIPSLFDLAFPGYLAAGQAALVFLKIKSGKPHSERSQNVW